MPQKDHTRTDDDRGILLYPQYMKFQRQHPRRRLFHSPDTTAWNHNTNRPLVNVSESNLLSENRYGDTTVDRNSFTSNNLDAEINDLLFDCDWGFLLKPEWLSDMDKFSLEMCATDNSDPKSWVNMATTDPPDEFWTEKLNFENETENSSETFLEKVIEGNAELVCPEVLCSILDGLGEVQIKTRKQFMDRFRELYMSKGLFDWAKILDECGSTNMQYDTGSGDKNILEKESASEDFNFSSKYCNLENCVYR